MAAAPTLRLIEGGKREAPPALARGHYERDPFPAVTNIDRALLAFGDVARGLRGYELPGYSDPFRAPVAPELVPATPAALMGRQLAPWPAIDRVPIVIGQNLSLAYITAAMRLSMQGWRYQFVDCFSELVEHDPATRGVLRQRIAPLAGARFEVHPAKLPESAPQGDRDKAKEIAAEVEWQLDNLPMRSQWIAGLAWGAILGLTGSETDWAPGRDVDWVVRGERFIHSRRLNLPRVDTWDVHVYDQGLVGPGLGNFGITGGPYGLRCADFPAKFVVHAPQGGYDYCTRDGEARSIAVYMMLKRMCVRASAQDFERTIRPWVVGYFKRDALGDGKQEFAQQGDIDVLNAAVQAIGNGSLNTVTISDACTIEILRAASEYPLDEFLAFLDDSIAKAILGQTDELGFNAVADRAHVHDLHATMLHLLGLDHKKLTFRFQGRDFRLTDVHGELVTKLIA